jgi:hypothetical protein
VDLGYTNADELSTLTRFTDVAGTAVVGTTVYGYDSASADGVSYNYDGSGDRTSVGAAVYATGPANRTSSDGRFCGPAHEGRSPSDPHGGSRRRATK